MFSVIIPAFNSEGHIRKLLDSIKSQSFNDYELVVICDSCHDNTEKIAKEYGAVTETVSFGRDGLTRDRGVELATGEWILFADDDYWFLHNDCFSQLADCIRSLDDDTDVVAFGAIIRSQGYDPPTNDLAHVWSACWKRSAIINARFGDAKFSSDTYFIASAKKYVRKYKLLDVPLYYYNFLRAGSQTDLFRRGIIKQTMTAKLQQKDGETP